ncbi:hypothetical protein ACNQ1T_02825 [Mycoplasma sp. 1932B]
MEGVSYLYLHWYENGMYQKWSDEHLTVPEYMSIFDPHYESQLTCIVSNLKQIKEAYELIQKYKSEGKYLCLLKEEKTDNMFIKLAGMWHDSENKRKLKIQKETALYELKYEIRECIEYFNQMKDFLVRYHNKFNALKAGKITTSVVSWLVSIGFTFLNATTGGSLSVANAMSILDSIMRTESAVNIGYLCNELKTDIMNAENAIDYIKDLQSLLDVNSIPEFANKIQALNGGKILNDDFNYERIDGVAIVDEFITSFSNYKKRISCYIAKKIIYAGKIAFKNTEFGSKLIEFEKAFDLNLKINGSLVELRDFFKKSAIDGIKSKISWLKSNLLKNPSVVKKLRLLNGVDIALSISDLALDITWYKTTKDFENEKQDF